MTDLTPEGTTVAEASILPGGTAEAHATDNDSVEGNTSHLVFCYRIRMEYL